MAATKKVDRDAQAREFISYLHRQHWMSLQSWKDGGHVFEMLQKRGSTRLVIVQIYPGGDGFNVWRPVCEENSITETAVATEAYGAS